jgi:hypothetical protein
MVAIGPPQSSRAALLGYAVSVNRRYETAFTDAVAWLRERQYFLKGRAPGFELDGLALLGVAVGLRASDLFNDKVATLWLKDLLTESLDLRRPSDWNEAMIAGAAEILGIPFPRA